MMDLGLEKEIFARIHTFGKAIGSHGAIELVAAYADVVGPGSGFCCEDGCAAAPMPWAASMSRTTSFSTSYIFPQPNFDLA